VSIALFYYADFTGRAPKARVHRGLTRASPHGRQTKVSFVMMHLRSAHGKSVLLISLSARLYDQL